MGIISPWMRNGSAFQYIKQNPNADTLQLVKTSLFDISILSSSYLHPQAYEVALGLQYIHSCGVVHGNLNTVSIILSFEPYSQINGRSNLIELHTGVREGSRCDQRLYVCPENSANSLWTQRRG